MLSPGASRYYASSGSVGPRGLTSARDAENSQRTQRVARPSVSSSRLSAWDVPLLAISVYKASRRDFLTSMKRLATLASFRSAVSRERICS